MMCILYYLDVNHYLFHCEHELSNSVQFIVHYITSTKICNKVYYLDVHLSLFDYELYNSVQFIVLQNKRNSSFNRVELIVSSTVYSTLFALMCTIQMCIYLGASVIFSTLNSTLVMCTFQMFIFLGVIVSCTTVYSTLLH